VLQIASAISTPLRARPAYNHHQRCMDLYLSARGATG
jgi:hypothetical protein